MLLNFRYCAIRSHKFKIPVKQYFSCSAVLHKSCDDSICVYSYFHLTNPCLFAIPCFILCPILSASSSVNLLFASSLSNSSNFLAWFHKACLAISLHLMVLYFFIIACRSSGTARVMFVILNHLSKLSIFTYLNVSESSMISFLQSISRNFCIVISCSIELLHFEPVLRIYFCKILFYHQ